MKLKKRVIFHETCQEYHKIITKNKSMYMKRIVLLLSSIYLLSGCSGDEGSGPWANFKPLNEIDKNIEGYYNASLGEAVTPKSGNPAVYVDFSDGLIQAYSGNQNNGQIVQAICNKLLNPNIEWYALGGSAITPLENNSTLVYNKVVDARKYIEIMAPIEEALNKITKSNNDALLITDFEEYKKDLAGNGLEQFENYPKTYFTDWIKKGNSIAFFYTDYTETNKKSKITTQKHLYYTVFTHGKATETSFVSMIKDALKGRFNTKVFELNNNLYTISNNYGGKENTGINNSTFAKWVNFNLNAASEKKMPYEVMGINKPWNDDLEKYIQNIIKKENGLFLNKLSLNAADQSAYKLGKVSVKVYDVSDDYEKFARCNEAKNHLPVLVNDSKKDLVWDEKSKKDPIIKECYVLNTSNLKQDWVYKPETLSEKEWQEVFDFDKEIFNGHLKNDPANIELHTIFHSNYKQKNVRKENALLRIDYVIDETTFNDSNPQLIDFQWSSLTIKDRPNTSLSEAIRNTLQNPAVNPKGKILYSYYIKFANAKKSGTN
jgi:hypothetical protein